MTFDQETWDRLAGEATAAKSKADAAWAAYNEAEAQWHRARDDAERVGQMARSFLAERVEQALATVPKSSPLTP